MRILDIDQVLELHRNVIQESGGSDGLRDMKILEGCLEQPLMTFGGVDLYPSLIDKGASLGFSLIANHPFVDGNKRIGHAAMEVFLYINGYIIDAPIDNQEATILAVASGEMDREAFTKWVEDHVIIFPL